MSSRTRHQKLDIIANDLLIKKKLLARINELGLTFDQIIQESIKHNIKGITKSSLSVYKNSTESVHGSLTQKAVIYLCLRYGVNIRIIVSTEEYDEQKCLEKLNKVL